MSSTPVSILVVCYQSLDLIGDCLRSVYEHTCEVDFEVLLTDCSNDGTVPWVESHFPQVRIIANEKNLGYAAGNNFLAKQARGDYLLLLNPDTLVKDNAIGKLLKFAQATPDAGAWGGVTMLPNGMRDPSCMQIGPSFAASILNMLGLGRIYRGGLPVDATQAQRVRILSGAFMMLPRPLWEELGGFDESFFMYNEEVDLCLRIAQRGYDLWMTPDASIIHLVGSGKSAKPSRMMAMMRSRMHLDRKHHGRFHNLIKAVLTWTHGATRYYGSFLLQPIRPNRAQSLREAFGPIVLQPRVWFHGYDAPPHDSKAGQQVEGAGQ